MNLKKNLGSALGGALLAGLLCLGSFGCAGSTPRGDAAVPVDPASALSLTDLDGASHALLDGASPTVLVFWATWCQPCRRELPELATAHAEYGETVRFLGVLAGDTKQVNEREARNLLTKSGVRYPQLRDFDGSLGKTFGVKGTPTVIVLGPDGQTRYHGHKLPSNWGELFE